MARTNRSPSPGTVLDVTTTLQRLGLAPDTRAVVIACDGLGSSNAANLSIYEALRQGVATTAGLQVPSPWARGAVSEFQGEDIGVSLTLNSEHDRYRWGPITHGPSLLDGDGGFPRTLDDLWDHADVEEARRECRAQIERAVMWGFDVSVTYPSLSPRGLWETAWPKYFPIAQKTVLSSC